MKIYNKFVESKTEPTNKNDIWFDGSVFKIYKEGEWIAITLTEEATNRLIQYAKSLDIYVMVTSLPEIGEEKKIYILQTPEEEYSVRLEEYIWENNTWKLVGNFNAVEPILESPFEKGDAENSVVLKGGNNQVISEGGVALGEDNLVGLKGFYYKYITLKAGGNTKLANLYLSKTQVSNPTIDTNSGASFKDTSIKPQNYWAVGDIISIVNDAKYDDIATVKQIKDGLVQIEWLDGKSPFSTVKPESDLSSEDYSIYCLDKPTQGISDLGKYSFATGTDNKAINAYTEVSGKGNVAKGKFGKVWGKDNIGGYNTTTFGSGNVNLADNSLVNGTNNINEGNNSVIHGNKNKNYGKRAFVVGNENITNNENEAAFGKYNNSKNDTQFSIGIGTSDTDRGNAFEVKQNGDVYITRVEKPIQTELAELSEEVGKRNVGAVDTDESVDEPSIPSGGGTPSGDPMHYMFEAVGAEWNGTGADIEKQGVYGDTITHKAGYWNLNELGDITNEEMRQIYAESQPMARRINLENAFSGSTIRTNIPIWDANRFTAYGSIALTNTELRAGFCDSQLEVCAFIIGPMNKNIQKHIPFSASSLSLAFRNASKLSKIIGCLNCSTATDYKTFEGTTSLKEVRLIRLKNSFSFSNSPLLSKDSVLFAIQNSEATSAITITLHADAYARLAEDADIVAALAEKTNVSLASA